MTATIAVLLLLAAASGAGVAFSREPRHQVFAMAANGTVLAILFMALEAPDVAFAEVVVGAAATPLLFLATLAAMRMNRTPEPEPTPPDSHDAA